MINFHSISELVALAEEHRLPLSEIVLRHEAERSRRSAGELWASMAASLEVMREAVAAGMERKDKSFSGLVGGDANRMKERLGQPGCLAGTVTARAAAYALAVSEVNAAMGKIVACPTAGSCGIVPGAILAAADECGFSDEALIRGLFTSAGIGLVIAENADRKSVV